MVHVSNKRISLKHSLMTTDNQHIPSGYKSSPLGVIPEDWEVKRLGEFSTFFSGGTPRSGNPSFYSGDIPFIRSGEIDHDKTELFLSKEGLENSSAKLVEKGDLLYALYGANSGQCAISKINGAINQAILCIRPNSDRYYILSVLQLNKDYYYNAYLQGGQGNLSAEIVSNYRIALPSIKKQKQICQLLSLWDTAIAKQTALIERLTLRKRGLMQQLLTGKKRLKGFEGEWEKRAINSFAKEVSIRNTDNKDYVVLSCTKYDGLVPSLEYFGKQIYSNDLSAYKVVPKNHFAYATNHLEEGSIGYQAHYNTGLISPMYTVFETDKEKVDDTYLFDVLKSHHLIYLYQAMMEGSINRRGGLRWDSFSTIKVDLPSLEEQKAISTFLHNADKEIEIQKQKLAALQEQKKGLMQVLLTGKRRVK